MLLSDEEFQRMIYDFSPVLAMAFKALKEGDTKYGEDTRFNSNPEYHILGALRHIKRIQSDERDNSIQSLYPLLSTDDDSGVPHIGHAIARLLLALGTVMNERNKTELE